MTKPRDDISMQSRKVGVTTVYDNTERKTTVCDNT